MAKVTDAEKRRLTSARNKLNKLRYEQSFHQDIETAPDLSEALQLGGFKLFKVDELASMPEVIRPLLGRHESRTLLEMEKKVQTEVPGFAYHRKSLPPGLVDDIFNLYYLPPTNFKFVEGTLANSWRIHLLQELSHYYMRALTERNSLYAYIICQELTRMLLEQLNPPPDQQPPEDPGDGSGGLSGAGLADKLTQMRDQAINKAQERIDKIEEAKADGTLPDGGDSKGPSGGKGAGKTGSELEEALSLLELFELMRHVTISQKTLGQFIKQSLALSTTYFSDQFKEREVEITEAEDILDIDGMENLLPQLKAINLEEVITHERLYKTGFDVYIDRSGSMSLQVGTTGARMAGYDLVKLTAVLLLKKKLANRVFLFDTQISEPMTDVKDILKARTGGGTNTEMVVRRIIETGVPSLILTDMQDSINSYTKLAYFVGILGARMYPGEQGRKFLTNQQFSTFDGQKLTIVKS